ncbi:MAG: glycine cleavage T C-terminal barrel domain-containing protein [Bryobacteraceae bacterium]|nr:glycine cleavage T C-terminal barrel domain-containing protein [Bryobacteraceae bacterium]
MNKTAYHALREQAAWVDLSGRGKIRATGEDRVRLLHAMCTNHVQQLIPGTGCYAFFLTAQGRILADANVFAMPDYLLLDTEPGVLQRLVEHLDKFIIADDVSLHDFSQATATIAVEGPQSEAVLNKLGGMPAHVPGSLVEWGHRQIAHASYTGGTGYLIFVDAQRKHELVAELEAAGVPQASLDDAETVRIENGRPRYGVDFTEAQIPHETRLLNAIHFSKGCYLGQEIVERVRSRGQVNRLLTPVRIEAAEPPARGTTVQREGKDVGEITSAAFSPALSTVVAFAILRSEAIQKGDLSTAAGARVTTAERSAPTTEH